MERRRLLIETEINPENYLCFTAKADGETFKFTRSNGYSGGNGSKVVYYSLDNGLTWTLLSNNTNTPTINTDETILWKSDLTSNSSFSSSSGSINGMGYFSSNCTSSNNKTFTVSGNILSLLYGDNAEGKSNLLYACTFSLLFKNCVGLRSAEDLILPTTTTSHCYREMFIGCTSLLVAPALPSIQLSSSCYQDMFSGCTSLTTAPELPATNISTGSYYNMFKDCTALTTVPEIEAFKSENYTIDGSGCRGMFLGCTSLVSITNTEINTSLTYPLNNTLFSSCYYQMFKSCTALTTAPTLQATAIGSSAYYQMFYGCTSLVNILNTLPALTAPSHCYEGMFINCTSLLTIPLLPATTIDESCYESMFYGCTSLVQFQQNFALPATTLANTCYKCMFSGCTSLTGVSFTLPAEALTVLCYYLMFKNCAISTIPEFYPTSISSESCFEMFYGCENIVSIPQNILNGVTTLAEKCYMSMFLGCKNLRFTEQNVIKLPATTLAVQCYDHMFASISYNGTGLGYSPAFPATYLADKCYYFTFSGSKVLPDTSNIDFGDTLIEGTVASKGLRGLFAGTPVTYNDLLNGVERKDINGNTVLTAKLPRDSNDIVSLTCMDLGEYCYESMFYGCTSLTKLPKLPATTLYNHCYDSMFYGCTYLENEDGSSIYDLDASTAASYCYLKMFYNCIRLKRAPNINLTATAGYCCDAMFELCTALTTPPSELKDSSPTTYCYQHMFYSCTNLATSPLIKATSIGGSGSFNYMFYGTKALPNFSSKSLFNLSSVSTSSAFKGMFAGTKITDLLLLDNYLPTLEYKLKPTTISEYCYTEMFYRCTLLTTVPELPATVMKRYCYSGMFNGCTGLTSVPSTLLSSVTKLAEYCYYNMFNGCTSLVTGPASLPVQDISGSNPASYCYKYMFKGCTSLTTAPEISLTTIRDPNSSLSATACCESMFEDCSSLIESPILRVNTLWSNCYAYMFKNCSALEKVTCYATDKYGTDQTKDWLSGVPNVSSPLEGKLVFVANSSRPANFFVRNSYSGIPSNWTITNVTVS